MNTKKTVLPILVLLLLPLATGCKTHEGAYAPKNVDTFDLENQEQFVLLDKPVQRSITRAGPILERTLPDGRLEATVNVRNRERRRIQVQIDCVFKDENGFSTGDETNFQTLILSENEQKSVSFTSMNNRAKRFTFRVREAR